MPYSTRFTSPRYQAVTTASTGLSRRPPRRPPKSAEVTPPRASQPDWRAPPPPTYPVGQQQSPPVSGVGLPVMADYAQPQPEWAPPAAAPPQTNLGGGTAPGTVWGEKDRRAGVAPPLRPQMVYDDEPVPIPKPTPIPPAPQVGKPGVNQGAATVGSPGADAIARYRSNRADLYRIPRRLMRTPRPLP